MANEAYELVISGTLAGQFVQNVLHVNVANTSDDPPYEIAGDIIDTLDATIGLTAAWCDILPTDYALTSIRCRRVLVTGGPTAIRLGSALAEDAGQRTGTIQSAQVNPVIVLLTTLRPNRPGRIFVPGISEADLDAMVYVSGYVLAVDALIVLIHTGFTLDNAGYSASFGILRRAIASSDDIMGGRLSPLIGTQRRRLRPV